MRLEMGLKLKLKWLAAVGEKKVKREDTYRCVGDAWYLDHRV